MCTHTHFHRRELLFWNVTNSNYSSSILFFFRPVNHLKNWAQSWLYLGTSYSWETTRMTYENEMTLELSCLQNHSKSVKMNVLSYISTMEARGKSLCCTMRKMAACTSRNSSCIEISSNNGLLLGGCRNGIHK